MAIKPAPSASLNGLPGELPKDTVPDDVDLPSIAKNTIDFCNNLQRESLDDNILWRDFLSFTDIYRTFSSLDTVFTTFKKLSEERQRSKITWTGEAPHLEKKAGSSWVDVNITFSIRDGDLIGNCAGIVSVLLDPPDQWKIWMIRTWLEHYEGHGSPDYLEPVHVNNHLQNGHNHTSGRSQPHVYDMIIVGGGQGGLGLAGRSQALGISYKLFEDKPEIGDSWAHRYDSLKWHTIREFGHLPFGRTFSTEEENYVPIKRIGAGYRSWAERYGINAQTGTAVDSATWDEGSQTWTVHTSGVMGEEAWKAKNLALSIGIGSKTPVSPSWASQAKIEESGFKGSIIHSANYRNVKEFVGQRGIVIGTANTAHDVAEDMANAGMDTTMIQRSPTFIFPLEWLAAYLGHDYHLNKPTDTADREGATMPNKITFEIANRIIRGLTKAFPERFDALEEAGFKVDRYPDLGEHLLVRYGGHYVDIGSCARIAKGEIKVKAQLVERLTEDGILLQDGSELKADLIVLCTGFEHDFRKDAAEIVGQDIADQMDEFFGLDKEGELRGYAKQAGHPHLYYCGGEARLSRFFSRFVALQVQKEKLGQPLRPYLGTK